MADLPQSTRELSEVPLRSTVLQVGREGEGLETLNVVTAIGLGIRVGQDCIRQVLSGSLQGPLGPKPND